MLILLEVIAVIARLDTLEATVKQVSSYISLFFAVSKRTEVSKSLEGGGGDGGTTIVKVFLQFHLRKSFSRKKITMRFYYTFHSKFGLWQVTLS